MEQWELKRLNFCETNLSLNKFDKAISSVFNLFSLSAIMKLQFFCLPVSRFNSLKKRFGEFMNQKSRSSKFSRFAGVRRRSQARFFIFVYLVLLDRVRYRLYLIMLLFTSS